MNKTKAILADIEFASMRSENNLGLNQRRIINQEVKKVKYIRFLFGSIIFYLELNNIGISD